MFKTVLTHIAIKVNCTHKIFTTLWIVMKGDEKQKSKVSFAPYREWERKKHFGNVWWKIWRIKKWINFIFMSRLKVGNVWECANVMALMVDEDISRTVRRKLFRLLAFWKWEKIFVVSTLSIWFAQLAKSRTVIAIKLHIYTRLCHHSLELKLLSS